MSKIIKDDIKNSFHDIIYFIEVRHIDDAQSFMEDGMRLLGLYTCNKKDEYPFIYCLGWPKNLGKVSEHVLNYGSF
jgi:hypothetical protein